MKENQINEQVVLYVTDNASSDGTNQYLCMQARQNSNFFYQIMESNIGGAGGFARGLKFAYENSDCDMFLLIDDDAMLNPEHLMSIDDELSDKYLAYSGTVYVNGAIDTSHRLSNKTGRVPVSEYESGNFECDVATFCGLMVSRKLITLIGFPREDFFIWNDDTEYSYRIGRYSRILNVSNSVINHKTILQNKTGNIRDNWKEYYGIRNIIVVYKEYKNFTLLINKILKCMGKAVLLEVMSFFCKKHRKDYRYNAKIRLDAVYDGLCGRMGKNYKYLP